jgi:hypothetical protein
MMGDGSEAAEDLSFLNIWKKILATNLIPIASIVNRRGDRFLCVECGHTDHADFNAAKNLEELAMAGIYGFRSPQNPKCQSFG